MNLIEKNKLSNIIWEYILFIIWPLASFLYYLNKIGKGGTNGVLILFYSLFGFTYIYSESADSFNDINKFYATADLPFSTFIEKLKGLYSTYNYKPDILLELINFTLSRFTSDPRFFFMTLSLLLSLMLVKNLSILNSVYRINKNEISFIFLLFFLVLIPPTRILSFRHYFALLVYIYGVYLFFSKGNIFYLLVIIFSSFIHFGFLIAIVLFFLYKLLGNKNIIYYALIALSFSFYQQTPDFLRSIGLNNFEIGLNETILGYTNESYLESVSELQLQRLIIVNSYISWTNFFMIISIIYHKIRWKNFDEVSEKIYSFSLLFFAFVNFSQEMEAMTNRFGVLFQTLCCIFFIRLYVLNNIKANIFFKYGSILFIGINFILLTRLTIQYTNMLQLTPFLPLSIFVESDVTILDFIK